MCLILALCTTAAFSQIEKSKKMSNIELVKTAMTELFINRNLSVIDKYWSHDYIQHNPQIPNGHELLKEWVSTLKPDFKCELGMVIGNGEFVMIHSRVTGMMPKTMIVVDIFKIKNGKFVEHWDVMQEEVPAENTVSKNSMFPIK
jgi:predicted SnoaL-like aldol condensation-catalyzing enzyme